MTEPHSTQLLDAGSDHWLVVPLFGNSDTTSSLLERLHRLLVAGFGVVLVDNNPGAGDAPPQPLMSAGGHRYRWIANGNCGGVAGGFNRGIAVAIAAGANFVTLLDQDSILDSYSMRCLREPLERHPGDRLLVGPRIWDQRRSCWHEPAHQHQHQHQHQHWHGYHRKRLLISSGTTFSADQWPLLGPLDEALFIDFVDHAWCFRAQVAGFVLLEHQQAKIEQRFGEPHPHSFCRLMGLELYSPKRHYYSLRNLRWLMRQWWVPLDLRCKEVAKMLLKPWLWLLFEPQRCANLKAILAALSAPLPPAAGVEDALAYRQESRG